MFLININKIGGGIILMQQNSYTPFQSDVSDQQPKTLLNISSINVSSVHSVLRQSKFLNIIRIEYKTWLKKQLSKLNPISTNAPLPYPLKTSEHLRFSDVFGGYRSGTFLENGLKYVRTIHKHVLSSKFKKIQGNY